MPKQSVLNPVINGNKRCTKCLVYKTVDEFPIQSISSTGIRADCKECAVKAERKRVYGITSEEYAELLVKQDGVCAVCFRPETNTFRGRIKQLSVDHNHLTGNIRGLLCSKCNTALGLLQENKLIIQSLIRYLNLAKVD